MTSREEESDFFFIGSTISYLSEQRLSTNKEILQLLFFKTRVQRPRLKSEKSINQVAKDVQRIWKKAEIPTNKLSIIKKKIKKLLAEYRAMQKYPKRKKYFQLEENFKNKLEKLFDITATKSIKTLNPQAKAFLDSNKSKRKCKFSYRLPEKLNPNGIPGNLKKKKFIK